jgi:hypothetical protein
VTSNESLRSAGTVLVVFPTVVFGGASLLWPWFARQTSTTTTRCAEACGERDTPTPACC